MGNFSVHNSTRQKNGWEVIQNATNGAKQAAVKLRRNADNTLDDDFDEESEDIFKETEDFFEKPEE
ncbi:MAG: hypothetical protein KBD54_02160 [Candidatus Pacebacteria bacterium]|nr:hypothetical protein [Candidatus Paceibacterota bacterium]